jgi:hypothetical protein
MRTAPVTLGLLAAVLLTGCSSAGSGTTTGAAPAISDTVLDEPMVEESPTTPEPCGLVTPDQAATALGEPVEEGIDLPSGLPGQKSCGYNAIDSGSTVNISIIPGSAELWNQFKAASPDAEQITGVGDEAFRDAGLLQVRKGDLILSVFIGGLGDGPSLTAPLTTLAKAAIDQL